MDDVYVLAPVRTAIGSFSGSLAGTPATQLGSTVIAEVLRRTGVEAGRVDRVILGNVLQAGLGQNPARQAALGAGMPVEVPAFTLNEVCGSGLAAISLAASLIRAGEAECIIAGGMENMSRAPYYLPGMRTGARMGHGTVVDGMLTDGLWDVYGQYHMGATAENIAERFGITREQQDEFALGSQVKAAAALRDGLFKDEICAVEVPAGKGGTTLFSRDEYVREGATLEGMQKLRPAFKENGTVTAANASGINDGAAALMLVSARFAQSHGLKPFAAYKAGAACGVAPALMGLGPVPATQKALQKAGLALADIDTAELNEAFAAQAIAVMTELGIDPGIVNPNGGAIALGHPIGASGARIVVTLLHRMQRSGEGTGLAGLCIGGGMGEAAVFQRL